MATLTLTDLDKELLDGLQVLTDTELGRVQAHLVAGLPMIGGGFNWDEAENCVVSSAMSRREFLDRTIGQRSFGAYAAPEWRLANAFDSWAQGLGAQFKVPLDAPTLDRLAALLDMEWSRRRPLPAASSQEAILPTLKEAVLSNA